jgi:mannose-6-phosphate isomerase-like protein (cupin superfamily)/pyrroloquinoline quinone (PQQ) biosynthesis protein C
MLEDQHRTITFSRPTREDALEATVPAGAAPAPEPPRRRQTDDPKAAVERLHEMASAHRLWRNPLLKACAEGQLGFEDFQYLFSQYHLYSKNFTRYLSALMVSCENDYYRAQLAENLWEEGGGRLPEERHAEIFRNFLREGLHLPIDSIAFEPYTELFAKEYLDFCVKSSPAATSAFLSLGTEGIVSRLYTVFLDGLLRAGVAEPHLAFFRIHIGCDDEHAETIDAIMTSYFTEPDWFNTCVRAMNHALDLRDRFFTSVYDAIQKRRVQGILDNIQGRQSLAAPTPDPAGLCFRPGQAGEPLYENTRADLNIQFTVERVPFDGQVFDTRVVRIAGGKFNEKHRHAHESIFYVIQGHGRVLVNDTQVPVSPGDVVFVPRWAMHQSQNTGAEEMVILAVTDYGLTGKAYLGDYLKTARLKQKQATASAPTQP